MACVKGLRHCCHVIEISQYLNYCSQLLLNNLQMGRRET